MIGRDAELAVLRRLADGARHGCGAVALVLGEAGVGKTRLLTELGAAVSGDPRGPGRAGVVPPPGSTTGLRVLRGRAADGGGTYRAVAEALRAVPAPADVPELRPYRAVLGRIRPDWAPVARPEPVLDPTLMLGEGLLRVLRSGDGVRGAVLLLDDVHRADADTIALIEYLAGVVADHPLLVVVSARDEEQTSPALLRLARHHDVTVVPLHRLDRQQTQTLAEHLTGGPGETDPAAPGETAPARRGLTEPLRELLARCSDGLPLLIEELVAGATARDGTDPVPPTLSALVRDRLGALLPAYRVVLGAAAILPGDPDARLLAAVAGVSAADVVDALRAAHPHLLVPDGDRSRWRHALTRDAVAAAVVPPERAELARRGAEALLARGRPGDDAGAADLFALTGESDRLAALLLELAGRDAARGALRSAGTLLDRADRTGARGVEVATARVRVLTAAGRAGEALRLGIPLLADAVGEQHAALCLELADTAIAAGRWAQARRLLERAGRPGDPRSLCLSAEAAFGEGDPAGAAEQARAAAEAAGATVDVRCQALTVRARCALRDDPERARADFSRAAQLAAENGWPRRRIGALIGLATVDLDTRAHSPALDEAREVALDTGQPAEVAAVDLFAAETALTVDGPRAAAAPARRVAEQTAMPQVRALGEIVLAVDRAVAGDRAGMETLLDAAMNRPDAPVEARALVPAVRALRLIAARDPAGAVPYLDEAMAALLAHGTAAPVQLWGLWVLLRTVTGSGGEQARTTLRALPAARRLVNRGGLEYAGAVAAGRAGDPVAAVELLRQGDRSLAAHPWWARLLRLLVAQAAIADGWGDPVPMLRADLGAMDDDPLLARTCRDLLRSAGAPTRRGRGTTPVPAGLRAAGVTSREMDVLTLIGDGLTNRQIAERLSCRRARWTRTSRACSPRRVRRTGPGCAR